MKIFFTFLDGGPLHKKGSMASKRLKTPDVGNPEEPWCHEFNNTVKCKYLAIPKNEYALFMLVLIIMLVCLNSLVAFKMIDFSVSTERTSPFFWESE